MFAEYDLVPDWDKVSVFWSLPGRINEPKTGGPRLRVRFMMDLEGMRLLAGYDGWPTFDIYKLEMKIDPRVNDDDVK